MSTLKNFWVLSILVLLFQSCIITNTPGFHSGYKKLSEQEQEIVKFIPNSDSIPTHRTDTIYAINGHQVLNAIKYFDTSIVYLWNPNCHAKACVPLAGIETFCIIKGYELFPVCEYYDLDKLAREGKTNHPILSINHNYYKTDYCPKYTSLFRRDLRAGHPVPDSASSFRYYLFAKGRFVKAVNYLLTDL